MSKKLYKLGHISDLPGVPIEQSRLYKQTKQYEENCESGLPNRPIKYALVKYIRYTEETDNEFKESNPMLYKFVSFTCNISIISFICCLLC